MLYLLIRAALDEITRDRTKLSLAWLMSTFEGFVTRCWNFIIF